ncbi:RNA-binding protein [Candidatus Micrarchaeota archaeon]|nr:MAG: RNA-binding protein [Candidatus Micrarchaeota archaeon]
MIRCTSCNREVTDNYVKFKCPNCGKAEIVRCDLCKRTVVPYTCPVCGFVGP